MNVAAFVSLFLLFEAIFLQLSKFQMNRPLSLQSPTEIMYFRFGEIITIDISDLCALNILSGRYPYDIEVRKFQ